MKEAALAKTHAIRFHEYGGPEVLRWQEVEIGKPGPGQALIRQTAIGLNYVDTYQRTGLYPIDLPFVPGSEGAGIVEEVGPGVTHIRAGDRVGYPNANGGGYSERRIIEADRLVVLPETIDDRTAAATLLKGCTVYSLLQLVYPVGKGTTLLIHAAAGGIGLIFCQWAKHLGATVIGTVGSEEKSRLARANGCDHTINYRTEDFVTRVKEITGGKGCDVVYDSIGKDTFPGSLDCIRPRGMWVSFGQSSGKVPPLDVGLLMQKGSLFMTRMSLRHYAVTRPELEQATSALFQVLAKGIVRASPRQEFPLAKAADAHRALEGRMTTGSTILIP
jgi:NADPH2:quinone reductase